MLGISTSETVPSPVLTTNTRFGETVCPNAFDAETITASVAARSARLCFMVSLQRSCRVGGVFGTHPTVGLAEDTTSSQGRVGSEDSTHPTPFSDSAPASAG